MKIYKVILFSFLIIDSLFSFSQETTKAEKIKEYYISFGSISPLIVAIKYKRQLKNKTFFKIGLVNLSAYGTTYIPNLSTSFKTYNSTFSAGVESGLEFRKSLGEKFSFFHGPNVSFIYDAYMVYYENPALPVKQRKDIRQTYTAGIPYTLGILFNLKNHFFLSAEINPALSFSYMTFEDGQFPTTNHTNISGSLKFNNTLGFLSLVYRI